MLMNCDTFFFTIMIIFCGDKKENMKMDLIGSFKTEITRCAVYLICKVGPNYSCVFFFLHESYFFKIVYLDI